LTMSSYEWLFIPPFSALTILGVAFLMSLTTNLLNRKLINQEETANLQDEVKRYNADKERAKRTSDKKLLSKLKKQEKRIAQMQSKMVKGQTLNLVITFGLFFLVWQGLLLLYSGADVAYVPFGIPFLTTQPPYPIQVYIWYIICSFFSNSILSRVFGIRMGMGLQPQTTR